MDYGTILYETDGGKARITLNRPEKLNAISWQMQQELETRSGQRTATRTCTSSILRGTGRAFSAGYDITPPPGEGMTHAAERTTRWSATSGCLERRSRCGWRSWTCTSRSSRRSTATASPAGRTSLFLCDIVIAAEDARIGFPPVRAMGSPVEPHVDVPRRAAVGEAHAPHRRHRSPAPRPRGSASS